MEAKEAAMMKRSSKYLLNLEVGNHGGAV